MEWVSFTFEKTQTSKEAVILIERKTLHPETFTVMITDMRSESGIQGYFPSEPKLTFFPNENVKRIIISPIIENQNVDLKNDTIVIDYKIIVDDRITAELSTKTKIVIPRGFVPTVVHQEIQCLTLEDVSEEGCIYTYPEIKVKIQNIGDEEGYFSERLLEFAIFTENPKYSKSVKSRIFECNVNAIPPKQEKLIVPYKKDNKMIVDINLQIRIEPKCLTLLSKLQRFYLQINTYAKEDTKATCKLIVKSKFKEKVQSLIKFTKIEREKLFSKLMPENIYKELNIYTILNNYLKHLKEEVECFFDKLKNLDEPIISSRKITKYKYIKRTERKSPKGDTKENLWEKEAVEWEKILKQKENVIIQGPMGIGKTVLSYQIVRKLLEKFEKENQQQKTIPLRVEGKELNNIQIEEHYTFWNFIAEIILNKLKKEYKISKKTDTTDYVEIVSKKLQDLGYNFFIILDGYDEIFSGTQKDTNINLKSWIIRNCKEIDEKIVLIVTGRPWSIKDFIPLVVDEHVTLFKMEELSDDEIKKYMLHVLKKVKNKITVQDVISKKLKVYKKYYSELYSRPLYLRVLTLKNFCELSKPLSVFELLRDINIQTFCWTSVKFLPDIANTTEGQNLIQDYPNIQYLAKQNYLKFLETIDNKRIIKTEKGEFLTYKDLRERIEKFMEELAYKIIIEPLKSGKTREYLKFGEVETLLSNMRYIPIRNFFYNLVLNGNFWIVKMEVEKNHLPIEVLFFNVYKMLEFFAASYAWRSFIEKNSCDSLYTLLGNSSLVYGVTELLFPLIKEYMKDADTNTLNLNIENILDKNELKNFEELFNETFKKVEGLKKHKTYDETLMMLLNNWTDRNNWLKKNNIGILTTKFHITHMFAKNLICQKRIKKITAEVISKFKNLHYLDLSNNSLETLPRNFRELKNLQYLNISNNSLKSLPESFGELSNLQYLDLSGNFLETLPRNFKKLINLKILYLSGNSIRRLPNGFEKLKNLQELNLSHNYLEILPESFGELKNLRKLSLSGNSIRVLPENFGKIKNLEYLYLSGNSIKHLSNNFGELTNLKYLYLSHNSLETLPESFGNLSNLQELDLSHNSLETLPENLGELKNLRELDILGNSISKLPYSLINLQKLKYLHIPKKTLEKTDKRLIEHLKKIDCTIHTVI